MQRHLSLNQCQNIELKVCSNMSKLDDLHTLVRLLDEFKFPVSPILEYAIKEKEEELCSSDSTEAAERNSYNIDSSLAFDSLQDEFKDFIFKVKSNRSAHDYLRLIDNQIRDYISEIVDANTDTVYSFTTVSDFKECVNKLKGDKNFSDYNSRSHNKLTAAMSSYMLFLRSKENL